MHQQYPSAEGPEKAVLVTVYCVAFADSSSIFGMIEGLCGVLHRACPCVALFAC